MLFVVEWLVIVIVIIQLSYYGNYGYSIYSRYYSSYYSSHMELYCLVVVNVVIYVYG